MNAFFLFFLLLLQCLSFLKKGAHAQLPGFYHTTDDISEELQKLSKNCPELSIRREPIDADNFIDIISISKIDTPVSRFFLLAGEHARELIAVESALHFVKVLCGKEKHLHDEAQEALNKTVFQVIVNGNPISRRNVEQGDFCVSGAHLRVNENAVDLNRNWKAHWSAKASSSETYPGKQPFSEPETQIFQKAVTEFKPDVFLSVHTGTLGVYMPWAYKAAEPKDNDEAMQRVMGDINEKFCQCPSGPAGERAGYRSPGTCLDFVYDTLKVPFAYAFEIYAEPSQRQELHRAWKEGRSFHDAASDFSGEYRQRVRFMSRCTQNVLKSEPAAESSSCFVQFNPTEEDDYKKTLLNWSEAYLELSQAVVAELQQSPKQESITANPKP